MHDPESPKVIMSGGQAGNNKQDKQTNSKEGAKYAAEKYLPPPSKMHGITFHFVHYNEKSTDGQKLRTLLIKLCTKYFCREKVLFLEKFLLQEVSSLNPCLWILYIVFFLVSEHVI